MMIDYLLCHMPGSCLRVALAALEETGTSYRDKGIALFRGEQRQPEFLAINPKGKVPVLFADGVVLTELPVIAYYLANQHPNANLLPVGRSGSVELKALSDMIWLAGAVHPVMNRIFRPNAVSQSDADGVKAGAIAQLREQGEVISRRITNDGWWYGENWSIVDTFVAWIFSTAGMFGFPLDTLPTLLAHQDRVEARPAFARAISREREAIARDNLPLPSSARI